MRLLALLLLGCALVARAEPRGLVVVLPVDARDAKLNQGALTGLDESFRTVSASVLGKDGYTVLTSETTLEVLRANGIDAARACEASCALEAAREESRRPISCRPS